MSRRFHKKYFPSLMRNFAAKTGGLCIGSPGVQCGLFRAKCSNGDDHNDQMGQLAMGPDHHVYHRTRVTCVSVTCVTWQHRTPGWAQWRASCSWVQTFGSHLHLHVISSISESYVRTKLWDTQDKDYGCFLIYFNPFYCDERIAGGVTCG